MGLNIKNAEVERLATEIAKATGESKTEAIRQALLQRQRKLALPSAEARWLATREWLEREVWSMLPPGERGRVMTKEEQEEILGFGPEGF